MTRFKDQVAIVTGSAQGIGKAVALQLGSEGALVISVDQNAEGANTTAEECGNSSIGIQCDIGDPQQVSSLHETVVTQYGGVDVLVNNAAIVPFIAWDDVDFDHWRQIMRVNLDGTFLMCRASSDVMRKKEYGRIVNIISNTIFAGTPNMAAYVSAKGGVFGLTRALATELGAYKITVNGVTPGLTNTEGVQSTPHKDAFEFVEMLQPIKGHNQPSDIAPAVVFLASPEAHRITGQVLNVDAGMVRW
ncbi:MAG: pyridoxal 4-dehydrogenase [Acidiferrobacteraceae bacterium]|nr:pyridoxal 4-dehydrogenase [Acidiferrobacteraceae bacterium]